MNRPVMDITYLDDAEPTSSRSAGSSAMARVIATVRLALRLILRMARMCGRVLMYRPLSRTTAQFRNEDGSRTSRLLRGLAYRLAFVPVLAALVACGLVYFGTHPRAAFGKLDPVSYGIYFEPITLRGDDGVQIDAWLVPAIEARDVVDQREKLLRKKHPAIVLIHDFGNCQQQMLPFIRPLHDAGFVVVVPALRGNGNETAAGQTFGLREAGDVKVVVDMLRKRNFVDPDQIALLGFGTGANAAILTASADPRIHAVIVDDSRGQLDEQIRQHVLVHSHWLEWARPMCKWAFELAYEVDGEELDPARTAEVIVRKTTLILPTRNGELDPSAKDTIEQIRHFLITKT